MDESNVQPLPQDLESRDTLLSLDAEINEELKDHYARIELLEEASDAIHSRLNNLDSDSTGNTCDGTYENSDNEHNYNESPDGEYDVDSECDQDFEEEDYGGGEDGYDDDEDLENNDDGLY
ncbi:hypothetical protein CVT26_004539 [Gymnopilus dilepis]|uniref:Uncharacterized protein n=1 Tax=Gymnopilus dilepis TaxID=231916 RepID=A0A409YJ13_9AGAR|nr:hypothetical protein CVT26_004539 [Gymnopilus dilepis]